jgi:hypothetical protein
MLENVAQNKRFAVDDVCGATGCTTLPRNLE